MLQKHASQALMGGEEESVSNQPEPLDDDEVISAIKGERQNSYNGDDSGELAGEISKAWDYYYGRPRGDECKGMSSVQSLDVSDMVESLLSQVMPVFMTDTVAEFEAVSPEDAQQARLEADYVNYVIQEQNNGFITLQEAVKDALVAKNGIIKAYPQVKHTPSTETHDNVDPIALQMLIQPRGPKEKVYLVDMETQSEVPPQLKVTLRRVLETKKLHIEAVPVDTLKVSRDHDSIFLDDVRFIEQERLVTRSELKEMGYSTEVVDDLSVTTSGYTSNSASRSREQYHDSHAYATGGDDTSTDLLLYNEAYILLDVDQDGYAERRKICTVDDEVLLNEEVQYHPFCAGTPYLMPRSYLGLSIYDKLKEVQDQKTAFLRQYVDNMTMNNHRRMGVLEGKVNYDDATTSRANGLVRMKTPDAIFPIPIVDTGGSNLQALEYLDKVRTDRAGASLDMQGSQATIPTDTAHGVERQVSAKEMMAAQITRTLAETLVKSLYLLVHKTLRAEFPGEVPVPLIMREQRRMQEQQQMQMAQQQGQTPQVEPQMQGPQPGQTPPTQIQPGAWLPRERVTVQVGLSPGERMRHQQALSAVLQQQQAMKQSGSLMVGPKEEYEAHVAWCRASGLSHPERFFLDPARMEYQQKSQQQSQQQQQMQQMQQQMEQATVQAQTDIAQAEQAKASAQGQKVQIEGQLDSLKRKIEMGEAELDAAATKDKLDIERSKVSGDQTIELIKLEMEASRQLDEEYAQNKETVSE